MTFKLVMHYFNFDFLCRFFPVVFSKYNIYITFV